MSFQQTHRILDEISEGHDELVKEWAEKLSILIEKPPVHVSEMPFQEYRNITNILLIQVNSINTRRLIAYGVIQDEANPEDSDEENMISLQPSPSASVHNTIPEVLNEEDADYSNASEVSEDEQVRSEKVKVNIIIHTLNYTGFNDSITISTQWRFFMDRVQVCR